MVVSATSRGALLALGVVLVGIDRSALAALVVD